MHDLVLNGQVIKSREFNDDTPPTLASNKGKWLPRVVNMPAFDPLYQTQSLTKSVTATQSVWDFVVTDKPKAEVATEILKQLADKADQVKFEGITVGGIEISTDESALTRLSSALLVTTRKAGATFKFKDKTGVKRTADKAMLESIQDAIQAHYDAVDLNEGTHEAAITALLNDAVKSAADLGTYDINTGW
jgi:hypothetical protein